IMSLFKRHRLCCLISVIVRLKKQEGIIMITTQTSTTQKTSAVTGPVTAIIVGAGHRSLIYASYAETHPDQFQIVGVVDPDPVRRNRTAEKFGVSEENRFQTVEQLAARGKIADTIINGT